MKTKYCVGFFLGLFLLFSILGIGYQIGYQYVQNQHALPIEPSISAEGDVVKEEGYYLLENNGWIVVYLSDKKEIYEYTNIQIDDLPIDLQKEIETGKYIQTIEELYGILENYTS